MGLTVSIGLERFLYGEPPEAAIAMLERLVAGGYTRLVREVLGPRSAVQSSLPSVVEVAQVDGRCVTRMLGPDEAGPILQDLKRIYDAHGTYAAFSWDQLEEMGCYSIQDLALVLDGPTPRPGLERVNLGPDLDLRLTSLEDSLMNWQGHDGQGALAAIFHEIAIQHRLIVHSA